MEPGYHDTTFVTDEDMPPQVGFVEILNTPQTLEIRVHTTDGWMISDKLMMFIHHDLGMVPLTKEGRIGDQEPYLTKPRSGNPWNFSSFLM